MEQKFGKNSIDIKALREFCEREGKEVTYRKGDQLEREGDPARWFGYVTEGCFKYVNHSSDDREHITWFTMINLHACYCALFADIEQKSPFLFAGIK